MTVLKGPMANLSLYLSFPKHIYTQFYNTKDGDTVNLINISAGLYASLAVVEFDVHMRTLYECYN